MSKEAKIIFRNRVKSKISGKLTEFQKDWIMNVLDTCMTDVNIEIGAIGDYDSEELLTMYLKALEIQGRSVKTIDRYEYLIRRMMKKIEIPLQDITVSQIRDYLSIEKDNGLSNETLEGIRQVFSAFFGWLQKEGLVYRNPVANIGAIKRIKKIKKTYSEMDIEKLKQKSKMLRDKAIICFLYSTGCRISEMTQLNIDDVNFEKLECTVLGKGNKERTVYLDGVTAMTIKEYLDNRDDNEKALFVSNKSPHKRLEPGGVRVMLKNLQIETGVEHVHPHKFRRTRATRLVKHGMPIQEVAALLGHEKLDTTLKYVVIDDNDIKNSYQKYS